MNHPPEFESICIYCGSSLGERVAFRDLARSVGALIAQRGTRIVYGGGHRGLMGVVADAALAAGGQVVGVIPDSLMRRELAHEGLSELHVVTSMHERKQRMAELSDAFIALPGGWGTIDELAEIVTWAQLGLHHKPVGLLNHVGYFDSLVGFIAHMENEGFIAPTPRRLLHVADEIEPLLEQLAQARAR